MKIIFENILNSFIGHAIRLKTYDNLTDSKIQYPAMSPVVLPGLLVVERYSQYRQSYEYHPFANEMLWRSQSAAHRSSVHHVRIAKSTQPAYSPSESRIASKHSEFAQASSQNHTESRKQLIKASFILSQCVALDNT